MAIQNRRGAYTDLNPAKAVPGELLVVQSGDPNTTDGKAVYMTFGTGDIKRLATDSDVATMVADAADDLLTEMSGAITTFTETTVPNAIASIGDKGDEVIASIPGDYTTLQGDVATAYSTSKTYAVGDYVMYSGQLYRCKTAITTAESWTSGHWSEVKLTDDVGDLKSHFNNTDALGLAITSDMLELGRINDSGVPVSHSSRCRTKDFIQVAKGDKIYIEYDAVTTKAVDLYFYDNTHTFLSKTGWVYLASYNGSYVSVTNDGYFKCVFVTKTTSDWDKIVKVIRSSHKKEAECALTERMGINILPVTETNLELGYWGNTSSFKMFRNNTKVKTIFPIRVFKGDRVCFTVKNSIYADIIFKTTLDSSVGISASAYTNFPYQAPSDGYVFVNFRNSDNSAISDVSAFGGLITVKRATEFGVVETTIANELYNGYVTDSTYLIHDHATRLVNWMPIHANKGDIVRVNSIDLMYRPYEYNRSGTCLSYPDNYITSQYVGGNYTQCGDYIVQNNDCWIMCVVAPINGFTPSSFLPSDYPDAISVIHMEETFNINTAEDTMFRFPKAAKKGKKLITEAVVHQGATFVNGKLWACNEVSGGDDYIQVINPETGAIEKTITHNLGHCNCLDYCEDTDTLMTVDSTDYRTILLLPNASEVGTTISKSECISVEVSATDIDYFGTCCFGQDNREVFFFSGRGSDTPFGLYMGVLGYDSSGYTGNVEIVKQYNGVIRDNIDTYVTAGYARYAQDSCYDGYLYLAYGSSGHNFLVIDLDDKHNTYRVVGNYLHHEYKDDRTEYGVEPEGVALFGSKIYCLSRQNTIHASYFNIFER